MPIRASTMSAATTALRKHPLGDSLYNWAREKKEAGDVFTQAELLDSALIPDGDLQLLLDAVQYLAQRRLFRPVDIKGQTGIGYELIEEAAAANYGSLTPDEQMVYAAIEAAGTAGIWTKNIKARSNVHAKVLDGVYKSLEKRGLIKPMKSVKFPQRKMYIRNGLTPSEEATGGTWFNDGKLDEGMLIAVSQAVETYASLQSWREKDDEDEDLVGNLKRKQPATHQDEEGRGKTIKLENGQPAETVNGTHKKSSHPVFEPQPAGYQRYPTLNDFSRELRNKAITQLAIPNNALRQLLDVMVYDNRLYRLSRQARSDEQPDDVDSNTIYMYKSFTTPAALGQRLRRRQKIQDGNEQAMRAQELEDIGTGGFSEVPCLGCPVFDICGDGGPVNIRTCVYMNPWKESMEEADREAGDRWPADPKLRRVRLKQAGR